MNNDKCPICNSPANGYEEFTSRRLLFCDFCNHYFSLDYDVTSSYSIKEGRNRNASNYLEKIGNRYNYIKPVIKEGFRILDIGCAEGDLGAYVLERNKVKYIGLEPSLDFKDAKKNLTKIYNTYIEEHNPDTCYDLVLLFHVLEHIQKPGEILKRIFKWLDDKGTIIIEVPNSLSGSVFFPVDMNDEHIHSFSATSIGLLLNSCGFEISKLETNVYQSPVYTDSIRLTAMKKKDISTRIKEYKSTLNVLGKSFSVFGAGGNFEQLIKPYFSKDEIRFIFDSDINKQGKEIFGKKLINPKETDISQVDTGKILVSSIHYGKEIKNYLIQNQGVDPALVILIEDVISMLSPID
ncbi:class I SAM-dependent methyltransferase [Desulfospira joergensenii]|uniref:class I SAM-dependent methyltransferase n=1 Tax=Desulfospira joergensenii TaxID=53329 RepID=UPI0003B6A9A1|nr:methyltransferase domain-containing protein [Desulfospira joergensenii]